MRNIELLRQHVGVFLQGGPILPPSNYPEVERFTLKYTASCVLAAIHRFVHIRYVCSLNANVAKTQSARLFCRKIPAPWIDLLHKSILPGGKIRKLEFFH